MRSCSKLPPKYRAPFVLCCLEGRSRAEAAAELGWKSGTVAGRIAEARRLLQSRLTRRGVTFSATMTAGVLSALTAEAQPAMALIRVTARIGSLILRGSSAGGCSAGAMTLAHGMLRAMTLAKLLPSMLVLVALGVIASGVGVLAVQQRTPASAVVEGKPKGIDLPVAQAKTTHADRFGDPLPEGAIARLGSRRLKQSGTIKSLAFTTDGKQLLSFGPFDGMRVWDAANGKEMGELTSETGDRINDALAHPDGRSILTLESPQPGRAIVRLRNRADMSWTYEFQVGAVDDFCLSPDGKFLLCLGSKNPTAAIWDVASGQRLRSWPSHGWPYCQTFSRDSQTLVTSGKDKIIRFRDLTTGEIKREITSLPNGVSKVALSGDGKLMATLGMTEHRFGSVSTYETDPFIRVWDMTASKEVRRLAIPLRKSGRSEPNAFYQITFIAFAPDGRTLASAEQGGVIRFWDPAAGKEIRQLDLGYPGGATLAFSPDGKTLAVTGWGNEIVLVDIATGRLLFPISGHSRGVRDLALMPDGRTVATIGLENTIRLWDLASGRERPALTGHRQDFWDMKLAADGQTLVSTDADKTVRIWDVQAGKEVHWLFSQIFEDNRPQHLAVSPDRRTIVVACRDKPDAKNYMPNIGLLLDAHTGREIHRFVGHKPWLAGAAFTPDGRTLATWDAEQTVRLWDVDTGEKRKQYHMLGGGRKGAGVFSDGKMYPSYSAAISPDGRLIAECNRGHSLGIQELATGKEIYGLSNLPDGVSAVACSVDGRMLAWGGSKDPTIHVIELATGRDRRTLVGHRGEIAALAFSADGRLLLSGGMDTTALVWDLAGGHDTKAPPVTEEQLDSYWSALLSDDASRAYDAVRRLTLSPVGTVSYFRKKLTPVAVPDEVHLTALVAALDSELFSKRDEAMKELSRLAELAEPALRAAVDRKPSLETRRRLEQLLAHLTRLGTTGEPLRISRAVEVMQRIGTREARQLLVNLAGGKADTSLTREAKTALEHWRE